MNLLRAIRLFFSLVFREVEPKGTMEERYRIKGRIWPPLAWDVAYGYYHGQKETTNWILDTENERLLLSRRVGVFK
jgi:hypothetical protein